jgi:hypothetical protein
MTNKEIRIEGRRLICTGMETCPAQDGSLTVEIRAEVNRFQWFSFSRLWNDPGSRPQNKVGWQSCKQARAGHPDRLVFSNRKIVQQPCAGHCPLGQFPPGLISFLRHATFAAIPRA